MSVFEEILKEQARRKSNHVVNPLNDQIKGIRSCADMVTDLWRLHDKERVREWLVLLAVEAVEAVEKIDNLYPTIEDR